VRCEILSPIDAARLSVANICHVVDVAFGIGSERELLRERLAKYP